ncbi:MAG: S8 family serine peptidase [Candidatus Glassbacteria bacterium]
MKHAAQCILSLLLFLAFATPCKQAKAGDIDPKLEAYLNTLPSNSPVSVIVHLKERADIEAIDIDLIKERATRSVRHERVVKALKQAASRSQGALIAYLDGKKIEGSVFGYTPHWISNLIVVRATKEELYRLLERPDVDFIEYNFEVSLIEPVSKGSGPPVTGIGVTPGLYAIQADRVWNELGITGSGRLVANLDTGVDGNHPALADRWRGAQPGVDPSEAWLDLINESPDFPVDTYGHGTHVMGTETGLGAATGDTVGVAWGAQWIACNAINQNVGPAFDNDVITAFEWFADPDGDPQTVDDVPDVVQNSWGINEWFGYDYTDCDSRWWEVIDNCEAAGVVVTFSAGNEGPDDESLRSPADRATTPYNVFSIGAVDATNYDYPYPIASWSSRGPTGCDHSTIKPEVVAPGVDVYSCIPGGGYSDYYSGTSMAGPHVAGVVGLMREANPNLTVDEIKEVLMITAHDFGASGEDNTYGMGFIDAYESVLLVMSGVGYLVGSVTDAETGDPIPADLEVVGTTKKTTADPLTGNYAFILQGDTTYTVQASYFGYDTIEQDVYVTPDDTTILDFELTTSPTGNLAGVVMDYDDGLPIDGATVEIVDTPIPSTATGPRGIFIFEGIPAGATYTVQASAEGFGSNSEEKSIEAGETRILALPLKTGFSDAMETGAPGWTHDNVTPGYVDQWHLSTQRNHTAGGTTSWKCGSTGGGDYANYLDAGLETPTIDLQENSSLFFWHWIDAEVYNSSQAWDGAIVEISINGGAFEQITPVGGYPYTIYPNDASPFEPGTPCFSGTYDWQQEEFDLTGYSGDAVIRFRFGSDGYVTQEGWYIDDVIIAQDAVAQPVSVIMVPQSHPVSIGPSGGSFTYHLALINNTETDQSFDWWIDVTRPGGSIFGPLEVHTEILSAGETVINWNMEQTVPGWVPAGTYIYNAKVGESPDVVSAVSSFEFTKTGRATTAEEGEISDWVLEKIGR